MVDSSNIFRRMKSFVQFITEGLYVDADNNLTYSDRPLADQQEWIPVGDSLLKNADGTYRTKGKIRGFSYFFAYGMETMSPEGILSGLEKDIYDGFDEKRKREYVSDIRKQFLDAIKHPTTADNVLIIQELIEKSRNRFASYLRDSGIRKIDYIVTLPSKSHLNTSIASILAEWYPNATVLEGHLTKAKKKNVKLVNKYPHRAGSKKVDDLLAKQRVYFDKSEDEFKLSGEGGISPSLRDYVEEFIVTTPGKEDELKSIEGKTVVLVDDTIHVGSSLLDANREIMKYSPAKVFGYVFFNEKRSGWR